MQHSSHPATIESTQLLQASLPCFLLGLYRTLYGARGILRGGLRGLMSGLPSRLSTPTGDVRKGLCGGGPATGLEASPAQHRTQNARTLGGRDCSPALAQLRAGGQLSWYALTSQPAQSAAIKGSEAAAAAAAQHPATTHPAARTGVHAHTPDLKRRIFLLGLLAPRICSSCVALSGLMGEGHWQPSSSERSSML